MHDVQKACARGALHDLEHLARIRTADAHELTLAARHRIGAKRLEGHGTVCGERLNFVQVVAACPSIEAEVDNGPWPDDRRALAENPGGVDGGNRDRHL